MWNVECMYLCGMWNVGTRSLAKEHDIVLVRDTVIYRLEDALVNELKQHTPKEKLLYVEVRHVCVCVCMCGGVCV